MKKSCQENKKRVKSIWYNWHASGGENIPKAPGTIGTLAHQGSTANSTNAMKTAGTGSKGLTKAATRLAIRLAAAQQKKPLAKYNIIGTSKKHK